MRLNRASDFALRLLMLMEKLGGRLSIEAAATRLGLPKSHLMKIAAKLGAAGLVSAKPGPGGGLVLREPAQNIRIGAVVRWMETDFAVVDCMTGSASCVFITRCALSSAMRSATEAFLAELDRFTLAELAAQTATPPAAA
ncbi:MAG: Rrf2 family transcriptional regulator [Bauldia sp.]|nr:Rrf2 family transcriptional regulator [Bauldia sp.]